MMIYIMDEKNKKHIKSIFRLHGKDSNIYATSIMKHDDKTKHMKFMGEGEINVYVSLTNRDGKYECSIYSQVYNKRYLDKIDVSEQEYNTLLQISESEYKLYNKLIKNKPNLYIASYSDGILNIYFLSIDGFKKLHSTTTKYKTYQHMSFGEFNDTIYFNTSTDNEILTMRDGNFLGVQKIDIANLDRIYAIKFHDRYAYILHTRKIGSRVDNYIQKLDLITLQNTNKKITSFDNMNNVEYIEFKFLPDGHIYLLIGGKGFNASSTWGRIALIQFYECDITKERLLKSSSVQFYDSNTNHTMKILGSTIIYTDEKDITHFIVATTDKLMIFDTTDAYYKMWRRDLTQVINITRGNFGSLLKFYTGDMERDYTFLIKDGEISLRSGQMGYLPKNVVMSDYIRITHLQL